MTDATTPAVETERDDTNFLYFEFEGETFKVKRKFKRLRFLRLLETSPVDAFALAFEPADLAALEERDFDEASFEDFLEIVGKTLVGGKGN